MMKKPASIKIGCSGDGIILLELFLAQPNLLMQIKFVGVSSFPMWSMHFNLLFSSQSYVNTKNRLLYSVTPQITLAFVPLFIDKSKNLI